MIAGIVVSLAVTVGLVLWARLLVRSRHRGLQAIGVLAWLAVLGVFVSLLGSGAINRLDCFPGHEANEGWRFFEFGTDDVCEQRSLFEVLF